MSARRGTGEKGDEGREKEEWEVDVTIRCMYSCLQCGIVKAPVDVPVRGEDEDMGHWVSETVGWAIKRDHDQRSPACGATKIDQVWIPLSGRDKVGGPEIQ